MIKITDSIAIDEGGIEESFIRSSGPGGQNVNKVATAVQLRFDVRNCGSLPAPVKERLERLAGSRLTQTGVIVLMAQRFRTQERNREDALARLVALIRRAAELPKPRRATRPTLASKSRHREAKSRRGALKAARTAPRSED